MILDSLKLDGKVAIITGAGRGLGRAMAVRFAQAGADVVAAARTLSQLEETAALVKPTGRKCLIAQTDVTRSEQVNAMAAATIKELGRIDILINNAGGYHKGMGKPLHELTDDEWREGIDTNLTGQFYCCRAVITQMLKQQSGKIINIASGWGLRGGKNVFAYACAKGAVLQLTRSLAVTYAKKNIAINCIVPGIFEGAAQFFQGGKFIPLGRIGKDAELGPLALFLASDASNHLNGAFITIDGGGLAGGISPTGVFPHQTD
ncbi:MAG TPA: SDR family NAD(P)-dependent oxidoreductase [Candidatus Binataceae bacterium]|jgi:NAD(P)-dependent dehydrogenase (short-subunit alcohol dehydrogenase family)|nr:SDR family NAD(P)-dependent oxidoreductase [Candidatus Binataceae bacterium]